MSQIQSSNYLDKENFKKFLINVPKIPQFGHYKKPPMKPRQFQFLFELMEGSLLRVQEALNLTPEDFDFENGFLRIAHSKTGYKRCKCSKWIKRKLISCDDSCDICKGLGKIHKPQFTTLLPGHELRAKNYISYYHILPGHVLFDTNRVTVWSYVKSIIKEAEINLIEILEERIVKGGDTHLFRKTGSKRMVLDRFPDSFIDLKGRWAGGQSVADKHYKKPDLNALRKMELEIYGQN